MTSNSYDGQAFNPQTGSGSTGTSNPAQIAVTAKTQFKLTPARLNLSTGNTTKSLSITGSNPTSISYIPSLNTNNWSKCQAVLTFQSPSNPTSIVTAAPSGCSGVFNVSASVSGTTTNAAMVVVPPEDLIQVLWGEANSAGSGSQRQTLLEALGNTIGNRASDTAWFPTGSSSWQNAIESPGQFDGYAPGHAQPASVTDVDPFLTAAANVFYQSSPQITVQHAECFFSPIAADWPNIRAALATGAATTTVPVVSHDPKCFLSNLRQFVIKTLTGSYASGRPYFIFVQTKAATDPAVIQID